MTERWARWSSTTSRGIIGRRPLCIGWCRPTTGQVRTQAASVHVAQARTVADPLAVRLALSRTRGAPLAEAGGALRCLDSPPVSSDPDCSPPAAGARSL